ALLLHTDHLALLYFLILPAPRPPRPHPFPYTTLFRFTRALERLGGAGAAQQHDQAPAVAPQRELGVVPVRGQAWREGDVAAATRSEEHTSELQSPDHLVCRLLLENKKNDKQ